MTQSHHGGPEYHSTTTMNAIRKASPCEKGWLKLLKHLGKTKADDEPLDLLTVLDSNGLDDALWVLSYAMPDDRLARHFQAWCAEQVLPIFEAERDEARAQVAAAYGSAADALQNVAENWDCGHNESRLCDCARDVEQWGLAADEVRSMAPAHAQAALEAYGREKVLEGMQRAAALFPLGSRDGGIISSAILAEMETLK